MIFFHAKEEISAAMDASYIYFGSMGGSKTLIK
jgi:hypothetical protein